jgi:hypothetical protein
MSFNKLVYTELAEDAFTISTHRQVWPLLTQAQSLTRSKTHARLLAASSDFRSIMCGRASVLLLSARTVSEPSHAD